VESRVLHQPGVVRDADVLEGRAAQPRVGERQLQALEEGIDAEHREQQQTGRQEQVGGDGLPPAAPGRPHAQSGRALICRARSSIAARASFWPV
jgi:hypothetical protein